VTGHHRILVLLRHAKAARPDDLPDIERPLTERGRRDAEAVGHWLAEHKLIPDYVVCSPARRVRETWQQVATALPEPMKPVWDDRMYDAFPTDLLAIARAAPADPRIVLLIGHNPALEELSALLDPKSGAPGGLRTSGIAVHALTGDWPTLERGKAPLVEAVTVRG